jgi:hypothetical protein
MTKDGQEMAIWTGQGIGRFTSPGKIRLTGPLFFETSSTGKLAFLWFTLNYQLMILKEQRNSI